MKHLFSILALFAVTSVSSGQIFGPDPDKPDTDPQEMLDAIISAPADDDCGTIVDPQAVLFEQRLRAEGFFDRGYGARTGNYAVIRVAIRVVVRNDGSGAISGTKLQQFFDFAAPRLAEAGIILAPMYGMYIYSDTFYTPPNSATVSELLVHDPVPNALNIYFTGNPPGINGLASLPFGNGGVVMRNGAPLSTFAHEVGHYFGLYHTHETGFGAECVARNNCGNTGDLLCDTPADPNLSASVNNACQYTGTFTDPCQGTAYAPYTNNIMSYAQNRDCRTAFTPGQIARMNSFLTYHTRIDKIIRTTDCPSVLYVDSNGGGASSLPIGTWVRPYTDLGNAVAATAGGGCSRIVYLRVGPTQYLEPSLNGRCIITTAPEGAGSVFIRRP